MNKYKIAWEKWLPDGEQPNDDGWDKDTMTPFEKMENGKDEKESFSQLLQLSEMPINPLLRSQDYNFWAGHSNFYLTKNIANVICGVEGIEALDVASPYRMRIAIGKLFSPRDVMSNITQKVVRYINDTK